MKKILLSVSLCFFVLCLTAVPIRKLSGAEPETPEKKIIKAPELEGLGNDELLQQIMTIFNEASEKNAARLRALAKSEILLSHARRNAKLPDIPKKEPALNAGAKTDPVELAKIQSEHAKIRLEALRQNLTLIQTEKDLSDEFIRQTDNALSAVQAFISTIDGISLHLLEINLRVKDGTLSPDKIPGVLNPQKLDTLKQELTESQKELRKKAEVSHKSLETIVSKMEEFRKSVTEAESLLSSAEKKYSRELKRQTLEKEYSGQTLERLMAKLSEAEEERVSFNGAFNLSLSRFVSIREKSDSMRREIEKHTKPETEKELQAPVYIRAEEADQALKDMEESADYYEAHIKKLEELGSLFASLIRQGEILQADATVLLEHLFSMQVLAKKLEESGMADRKKISETSTSESLTEAADTVSGSVTEAVTAVQEAGALAAHIPGQKEEAEKAHRDRKEILTRLKETRDSAVQSRHWASELEKLTPEQVVSGFQETAEKLLKSKNDLDAVRQDADKLQTEADDIFKKIVALKDPLVRTAQQESLEEKYNILKLLYQTANLEFRSEGTETPDRAKSVLLSAREDTPAASLSQNWQTLLSTRLGIVCEKQKLRAELFTALNRLNQKNEQYATVLSETVKLTLQHHASALELKKRLGRKQIGREQIPDGITDALRENLSADLEKESAELMNRQTLVKQQMETLSRPDETLEKTQTLLTQALASIGKRLDFTAELKKLEQDFERRPDQFSEAERKELEHATIRRMELENTVREFFLSLFVPSESGKNLDELLQVYYRDIIEQEFRQANLAKRKEITDRLTGLADAEKAAVSELLPLLRKEAQEAEIRKDEEWVKIRACLMPDKAGELTAAFKSRTGRSVSVPPPVPEEQKAQTVQNAAAPLFERHIEQAAAKKWIDIFEQRVSASGIEGEIGKYRDQKGALDAASLSIQRRINQLSGHPVSELEKLTPEEKPVTKESMDRFLKGEIGMLRADRYKIWMQKAVEVAAKLTAILASAIFIHWLTNFLAGRFTSRKSETGKIPRAVVIIPLLKTFLKFFIWIVAAMAALSSLGFNIGAILAGFGIGGLAIAMAAQATLSDVLGGISILLSKSFKPGDIILFKGEMNMVEDIGLRYTRMRPNPTRFLVTVPNSQLAQAEVVNVIEAPGLFININLPLSTRNSKEKIQLALELVSEIVSRTPDLELKNAKFGGFGEYSFIVSVRYVIHNIPERGRLQTELNQEIVRQFNENHIEFAVIPHADADHRTVEPKTGAQTFPHDFKLVTQA